jgi:hypothetical protein
VRELENRREARIDRSRCGRLNAESPRLFGAGSPGSAGPSVRKAWRRPPRVIGAPAGGLERPHRRAGRRMSVAADLERVGGSRRAGRRAPASDPWLTAIGTPSRLTTAIAEVAPPRGCRRRAPNGALQSRRHHARGPSHPRSRSGSAGGGGYPGGRRGAAPARAASARRSAAETCFEHWRPSGQDDEEPLNGSRPYAPRRVDLGGGDVRVGRARPPLCRPRRATDGPPFSDRRAHGRGGARRGRGTGPRGVRRPLRTSGRRHACSLSRA